VLMPLTALIIIALLFTVAMTIIMPMSSSALTLRKPVDCEIGISCFIQNYVDLDPVSGAQDYTCGHLTYDGHKGTDFRLRDLVQMREGVNVLAAADGVVLAVRNGMPDANINDTGAESVENRECGNGVLIAHKDGYQTQYCHLMNGSVIVQKDMKVKAGHILGKVGMSGQTEFPHLHLEVRDKDKNIIDPFVGPVTSNECGESGRNIWHRSVRSDMEYISTAILSHGFTDLVPDETGARNGEFSNDQLPSDANAIIFWADTMGLQDGDEIVLTLKDPDGQQLVHHAQRINRDKAVYFYFIGKRRTTDLWPEGEYRGDYFVNRGKNKPKVIMKKSFNLTVASPGRVKQ
jgi:murein DD-endopeptidase MepM/ murein hydrolase activator NlpD